MNAERAAHPTDTATTVTANGGGNGSPTGPSLTSGATLRQLAQFLPDVAKLLYALARDPRVPWQAKLVALGGVVYVVSPIDVIPDVIPVVGAADDLYLVVKALQYLVQRAGYDLVQEHWEGSDDGFALLLMVAGIER